MSPLLIKRLAVILAVVLAVAFLMLGSPQLLSPKYYQELNASYPVWSMLIFCLVYVVTASLPVAAIMTLLGGAIFGFWTGLILVSFSSSLGALLTFLLSRFLLQDWVQSKFSKQLATINKGVEREGVWYLVSMRLIPVFPPSVINVVFGLTTLKPLTFYVGSQLGMLLGTAVYVNAGAQLGSLDELSPSGIFTPQIIFAFVLLGVLPWIAKLLLAVLKRKTRQSDAASSTNEGV